MSRAETVGSFQPIVPAPQGSRGSPFLKEPWGVPLVLLVCDRRMVRIPSNLAVREKRNRSPTRTWLRGGTWHGAWLLPRLCTVAAW